MGRTLRAEPATLQPLDTESCYTWMRDGTPIPGATGTRYSPGPDDIGRRLSVLVDHTRRSCRRAQAVVELLGVVMTKPSLSIQHRRYSEPGRARREDQRPKCAVAHGNADSNTRWPESDSPGHRYAEPLRLLWAEAGSTPADRALRRNTRCRQRGSACRRRIGSGMTLVGGPLRAAERAGHVESLVRHASVAESPRVSWRLGYLEPAPVGTGV